MRTFQLRKSFLSALEETSIAGHFLAQYSTLNRHKTIYMHVFARKMPSILIFRLHVYMHETDILSVVWRCSLMLGRGSKTYEGVTENRDKILLG